MSNFVRQLHSRSAWRHTWRIGARPRAAGSMFQSGEMSFRGWIGHRGLATINKPTPVNDPELALEEQILQATGLMPQLTHEGSVADIKNHVVSITGLRSASINSMVKIHTNQGLVPGYVISMETNVVRVAVLESCRDIQVGAKAELVEDEQLKVPSLQGGKVVTPDGRDFWTREDMVELVEGSKVPFGNDSSPGIIEREPIRKQLHTNIFSIDGLCPIGLGQRVVLSGANMPALRETAIEIVANQKENKDIDHVIWLSVGQDQSGIRKTYLDLSSREATAHTTILAVAESEPWTMKALAPNTACAMADIDPTSNVLLVVDNLASIGQALSDVENAKTLATGITSSLTQPHKWLERVTKRAQYLGGGSITALCLLHTDFSVESDKVRDLVASQVDSCVFMSNQKQRCVQVIGEGVLSSQKAHQHAAFAELASSIRAALHHAANTEKSGGIAKQLGIDPMNETQLREGLIHATNLRALFETDIRKRFAANKYEQLIALYMAAHGYLEHGVVPSQVEPFVQAVWEKAVLQKLDTDDSDSKTIAQALEELGPHERISDSPVLEYVLRNAIEFAKEDLA
mmetsp:Transcript_15933/g.26003  ORF Transcript_15933/g.26003 Transcript_15933/m.26003 type:complete len:574 (-) Transcript_15933:2623-4344(-)